jgi:hypothetical protein
MAHRVKSDIADICWASTRDVGPVLVIFGDQTERLSVSQRRVLEIQSSFSIHR